MLRLVFVAPNRLARLPIHAQHLLAVCAQIAEALHDGRRGDAVRPQLDRAGLLTVANVDHAQKAVAAGDKRMVPGHRRRCVHAPFGQMLPDHRPVLGSQTVQVPVVGAEQNVIADDRRRRNDLALGLERAPLLFAIPGAHGVEESVLIADKHRAAGHRGRRGNRRFVRRVLPTFLARGQIEGHQMPVHRAEIDHAVDNRRGR